MGANVKALHAVSAASTTAATATRRCNMYHVRHDVDAQPDDGARCDLWRLQDGPRDGRGRRRPRQLRPRNAGHPGHERRRATSAAIRATPACPRFPPEHCGAADSTGSETSTGGTRSSATSAPTRSRRTSRSCRARTSSRFGYSLNRLRMNHWQPELGSGPRGLLETAANATALKGGDADSEPVQRIRVVPARPGQTTRA